ncbi:hypothetical protein AHF37_09416 [Paragonimus kellicotti]|nr:hypothetical protein AHF37_09416 [Paragonimus kellicotti]
MNTTCSQMEQLLHHNLATAQLSRWRSQLNPPPRCQIKRAMCVPYMQQFRIPPPPIFMHTITSMEDPVQACVQTVRRDADSNTCVLQNSINYPVIQASDGSFIVSVSSEKYIQRSTRSRSVVQTAVSGLQIIPVSSEGWVKTYSKEESTTVSTPSGHLLQKSKSTVSFISGTHSTSADTLADTVEYTEWSTSQPKVSFHKSVVTYATENRRPRAYSSVTREYVVLANPLTDSRQADASVYTTLSSSSNEVDEFLSHPQFAQEQTTTYTIEERFTPVSHIVKHLRRSIVSRKPLELRKKNPRRISKISDISDPFHRHLPKGSTVKVRKVSKRTSLSTNQP